MPYRVILTVKQIGDKHPCEFYKVGDKITFEGAEIVKEKSGRLCLFALSAMLPYITALSFDTAKDNWINYKKTIQCPDNDRPVIFQIEREPMK